MVSLISQVSTQTGYEKNRIVPCKQYNSEFVRLRSVESCAVLAVALAVQQVPSLLFWQFFSSVYCRPCLAQGELYCERSFPSAFWLSRVSDFPILGYDAEAEQQAISAAIVASQKEEHVRLRAHMEERKSAGPRPVPIGPLAGLSIRPSAPEPPQCRR